MKWQNALKDYQLYLKIERGLSDNSISNYSFDVKKLIKYLEDNNIAITHISISKETIQQFIYTISKTVNACSQSRLISGLKALKTDDFSFKFFNSSNTIVLKPSSKTLKNFEKLRASIFN